MKKLTPQEMLLLETLETHAARMSGIQAMLEILSDWDHLPMTACPRRRAQAAYAGGADAGGNRAAGRL